MAKQQQKIINYPAEFMIYVKLLTGETIMESVSGDTTVAEIMSRMEEKQGIKVEHQNLFCNGKSLISSRTLAQQGVGPGSTIHLLLKVRGGR